MTSLVIRNPICSILYGSSKRISIFKLASTFFLIFRVLVLANFWDLFKWLYHCSYTLQFCGLWGIYWFPSPYNLEFFPPLPSGTSGSIKTPAHDLLYSKVVPFSAIVRRRGILQLLRTLWNPNADRLTRHEDRALQVPVAICASFNLWQLTVIVSKQLPRMTHWASFSPLILLIRISWFDLKESAFS